MSVFIRVCAESGQRAIFRIRGFQAILGLTLAGDLTATDPDVPLFALTAHGKHYLLTLLAESFRSDSGTLQAGHSMLLEHFFRLYHESREYLFLATTPISEALSVCTPQTLLAMEAIQIERGSPSVSAEAAIHCGSLMRLFQLPPYIPIVLGSDPTAHIALDIAKVANRHLTLLFENGTVTVTPIEGSLFIGDTPINQPLQFVQNSTFRLNSAGIYLQLSLSSPHS